MSGSEPHDIVPEDFDLDSAKRRWSSTDNADREHCPDCHAMSIVKHADSIESHGSTATWHCSKCKHDFDEPIPHEAADRWTEGDA